MRHFMTRCRSDMRELHPLFLRYWRWILSTSRIPDRMISRGHRSGQLPVVSSAGSRHVELPIAIDIDIDIDIGENYDKRSPLRVHEKAALIQEQIGTERF